MTAFTGVRFANGKEQEFAKTLNRRVHEFIKSNKSGRFANNGMILKTFVMIAIYFVPYFSFMTGAVTNIWGYFGLMLIMGVGVAGLGLSVMHDANHGAYSKNKHVNAVLGYTLNLIGGNATNWKIQHNVMHHTYTNVVGLDEDISPIGGILRFNNIAKKKSYHKWQFIYAWLLYGLLTFSWVFVKDSIQMFAYTKKGLVKGQVSSNAKAWAWLIFTKLFYYTYIFVLPILFTDIPWYFVFLGFFLMHYAAGFILAVIFQTAHVIEGTVFEDGDQGPEIDENWTVHQLKTTCNFAPKNKPLTWFIGGLNYQVEHHLFPNICHAHYPKISKIVQDTAKEYDIVYNSYPSFASALRSHGKVLYDLGR